MDLTSLCQVKDLLATVVQVEASLKKEAGLTLNQAFVLCCLARGPLGAGALAEELRIQGPSLSRVIKVLYHKGYLDRSIHWGDSRQKVLALTEAGQKAALHLTGCEDRLFPVTVEERGLAES